MSAREAKEELFKQVEQQISLEMSAYIKEQEEEAKSKAADMSRDIIANAINRYAQEEVTERTVTVVDPVADVLHPNNPVTTPDNV